jgi:hypothetical protein
VPLLAWVWPLALVVPLLLLIDVAASLLHAGLNRTQVAWREIPPLVPGALLGAVAGVLLISLLRTDALLVVLGSYIVAVDLRGLRAPRSARPWRPAARGYAVPAGLAIGLVEGLFGTAGPVVIAWLLRRICDPYALRATVPPAILVVASTAILGAGLAGLLAQPALWTWFAVLLPVALLAVVLGHRLARRLSAARPAPLIHGLLVASGLVLALRALA